MYWTHYWSQPCVNYMRSQGLEGRSITTSTGNRFTKDGVAAGDAIFVLSATQKSLFLIGRMIVRGVMPYSTYVQKYRPANLWRNKEVVVGSGTPSSFELRIPEWALANLKFSNKRGESPFFADGKRMDAQGFRGLHRLHPDSAKLLNGLMEAASQAPELLID